MSINYNNSMTLDYFLTLQQPDYSINLTGNDSKVYQLAVNFYPTIGGAFYFNNFYAGISYEEISPSLIQITEIYSNGSNNGINEGRIPVGALITKINGIQLNLVNTSVKDFVSQNVPVTPGDQIILTDSNNINYTLNTTPIPVISVFIGLTSQDYWLSGGNILGEILGPSFPDFLSTELQWTWLLALSVALFNLLPISVFDGGRVVKELIHLSVGRKYKPNCRKKIHYEYNSKDPKQQLMTHDINKIISAKIVSPYVTEPNTNDNSFSNVPLKDEFPERDLKFRVLDVSNSGYVDTIEIIDKNPPAEKSIIEVDVDYDDDLKLPLKKKIYWTMSLVVIGILAANFIISIVKYGTSLFWLNA